MSRQYIVWLKIAVIIGAVYLFSQVTPIYLPIILATVLAFILNPLVSLFTRLRLPRAGVSMPRGLAVLLSIVIALSVLATIITFIFMPFINEFNKFVANLPFLIERIQSLTGTLGQRATSMYLPENVRNLVDQALSGAATYAVVLGRKALNASLGFASQVVELVVVPVLLYYFLKDWQILKDACIELFPQSARTKAGQILEEMGKVVSGYITGQVFISILMGFVVFLGMYGLGVDYPLVLGLLTTLTETIPIIGSIIGAAPAVFLAYLVSPELALKVIIYFFIINQIESHIIVPKVMGHTIALHPIAVILSLLVGGQLWGIAGMILAVPMVALLKVLFSHLWRYE